jgi:hypothetical protein
VPGVRIQHLTERSATFTIVDGSRPYRAPLTCAASVVANSELVPCARTHVFKTYHLNLDETGAVIVSPTIWERMAARLIAAGFRLANAVERPPDQVVHVPRLRLTLRVRAPIEMEMPHGT